MQGLDDEEEDERIVSASLVEEARELDSPHEVLRDRCFKNLRVTNLRVKMKHFEARWRIYFPRWRIYLPPSLWRYRAKPILL